MGAVFAQGTHQIFMLDGRTLEGTYVGIRDTKVQWKMTAGSATFPLDEVSHVEFPEPRQWEEVLELFEAEDYDKAIQRFKVIASSSPRLTYYPAPGNFATLANRRLLDCYRKKRDWKSLQSVYKKIDWSRLPKEDRKAQPLMAVWDAIGRKEWDEALELADSAEKKVMGIESDLGFARALCFRGKGDANRAVIALAEAYGPYPGQNREMAKETLIEAADILTRDPERRPELQALVHTYAGLFGEGALWADAKSLTRELLREPLNVSSTPTTSKGINASSGSSGLPVRYVRIHRTESVLYLGEVEIVSGGYNIAPNGRPKMSKEEDYAPAGRAIDDDRGDDSYALGRSDGKEAWWEIDLQRTVPVESITVFGEELEEFEGFILTAFDGDRQKVFESEPQKGIEEETKFVLNK